MIKKLPKAPTYICLEIDPSLVIAGSNIHTRKKQFLLSLFSLFIKRERERIFWSCFIFFPLLPNIPRSLRFLLRNYFHLSLVGRLCKIVNPSASPLPTPTSQKPKTPFLPKLPLTHTPAPLEAKE